MLDLGLKVDDTDSILVISDVIHDLILTLYPVIFEYMAIDSEVPRCWQIIDTTQTLPRRQIVTCFQWRGMLLSLLEASINFSRMQGASLKAIYTGGTHQLQCQRSTRLHHWPTSSGVGPTLCNPILLKLTGNLDHCLPKHHLPVRDTNSPLVLGAKHGGISLGWFLSSGQIPSFHFSCRTNSFKRSSYMYLFGCPALFLLPSWHGIIEVLKENTSCCRCRFGLTPRSSLLLRTANMPMALYPIYFFPSSPLYSSRWVCGRRLHR